MPDKHYTKHKAVSSELCFVRGGVKVIHTTEKKKNKESTFSTYTPSRVFLSPHTVCDVWCEVHFQNINHIYFQMQESKHILEPEINYMIPSMPRVQTNRELINSLVI